MAFLTFIFAIISMPLNIMMTYLEGVELSKVRELAHLARALICHRLFQFRCP